MGKRDVTLYVCDVCERELLEPESGIVLPLSGSYIVGGTNYTPGGTRQRLIGELPKRVEGSDRENGVFCLKCLLEYLPKPQKDWGANFKKKAAGENHAYLQKLEALDQALSENDEAEKKAAGGV